jgi:hypothetical protein
LQRLPLAEATLSLWADVLPPTVLAQVVAHYQGRRYADPLTVARFGDLIGDALLEHEGSGRQSFTRAQEQGTVATAQEAVYGKLRRGPLSLSLGGVPQAGRGCGRCCHPHIGRGRCLQVSPSSR